MSNPVNMKLFEISSFTDSVLVKVVKPARKSSGLPSLSTRTNNGLLLRMLSIQSLEIESFQRSNRNS